MRHEHDQYFTRDGKPIPKHLAIDARGIIRDGVAVRTRMSMRDSMGPVRVTDGGGGTAGLHRPGFRIATHDASQQARDAANADYQRDLTSAWRGDDARRSRTVERDPRGRIISQSETEIEEEDEEKQPKSRDAAMRDALAAHREHENYLNHAYKLGGRDAAPRVCPACNGSGRDEDGAECEACAGTGYEQSAEEAVRNTSTHTESTRIDSRSVARAHRQHMSQLYDSYDAELREAWRSR
jgi:hypothetical protein